MSRETDRPSVSILGNALLGLLAGQPMSGYDLTRTFDGSLRHVWSAKHAQIYPELARLAENGLVTAGESGARGRKLYTITGAGLRQLRHWLAQTQPEDRPHNEALLRSFFLWTLQPQEARAYLKAREDAARAALAQYEAIAAAFVPATPQELAFRVALESGLRFARAGAEWAKWAAQQYESAKKSG